MKRSGRQLILAAMAAALLVGLNGMSQAGKEGDKKMKKNCVKLCQKVNDANREACKKNTGRARYMCNKDAAAALKKCKEACSAK